MNGNELPNLPGGSCPRVDGCFYSPDIAAHHYRNVAGTDVLAAREHYPGRFDHGIGRLDGSYEPSRLDHPQGFHHGFPHRYVVLFVRSGIHDVPADSVLTPVGRTSLRHQFFFECAHGQNG